ncbi:hypothetical protein SAMD00023353_11500170 [Rosellinia necatrix]|uniref:Uncharacterized protein n=1 Tax=Rosellinia necatrix TaxID=77044 RepID=A0A1S8ABA3_ROSNE|nr:hypothetical protein SAMD00023353_11500170 [Rosellinia necatrix]
MRVLLVREYGGAMHTSAWGGGGSTLPVCPDWTGRVYDPAVTRAEPVDPVLGRVRSLRAVPRRRRGSPDEEGVVGFGDAVAGGPGAHWD